MDKDHPITANDILKWGGICLAALSPLVTSIWFAAGMKGEIGDLRLELAASRRETSLRVDQQDKDISGLKNRADNTDRTLADMARKLDVAVALLERIDQKVGRP